MNLIDKLYEVSIRRDDDAVAKIQVSGLVLKLLLEKMPEGIKPDTMCFTGTPIEEHPILPDYWCRVEYKNGDSQMIDLQSGKIYKRMPSLPDEPFETIIEFPIKQDFMQIRTNFP